MTDILRKILDTKVEEVAAAQAAQPLHAVRAAAEAEPAARDFYAAILAKHRLGLAAVIAEIKKASPSKGLICADFQPERIAREYAAAGAACLSVLTDAPYFQGSPEYLQSARAAVGLPALRKDFIVDAYQIYQARAWGADAVLLIAAALDKPQLQDFESLAHELGMTVLLELHDASELNKCADMRTPLWGVNNRNLRTFEVSLEQTLTLLPQLGGKTVVTESGIFTADDVRKMRSHGVHTFLVGESLMRAGNTAEALRTLVNA